MSEVQSASMPTGPLHRKEDKQLMATYDGTDNESLLLSAIEAILDSEAGVKSLQEAAELFARLTGNHTYDAGYGLG